MSTAWQRICLRPIVDAGARERTVAGNDDSCIGTLTFAAFGTGSRYAETDTLRLRPPS